MRIFGISVIKNEADIIEYSLNEASKWADKIFVMDNGSTDGTWEIVLNLAARNIKIVPWKQLSVPFTDGLRADVFNNFKHHASPSDWWCMRLDSDEFYIDDPRIFLNSKVKNYYHVVCSKSIQYRITNLDVDNLPMPIEELISSLKYHEPFAHSEIRFFKHRNRLNWDRENGRPTNIGLVSPERILLRHYQYRSLEQIRNRIKERYGLKSHTHIVDSDWKKYIIPAEDCLLDKGLGSYQSLPLSNNKNLNYRWWVFLIRRFCHTVGIFP